MSFESPEWLVLLPLVIPAVLAARKLVSRGAIGTRRGIVLGACLALAVLCSIFAAASPVVGTEEVAGERGVVVADVSSSRTAQERQRVERLIARATSNPAVMGTIEYGTNVRTNTADALTAAASVVEKDGRIFLLSDGADTHGDLASAAQLLLSRNIKVDVAAPLDVDQIAIAGVTVEPHMRIGQEVIVEVRVASNHATDARIVLQAGGKDVDKAAASLSPGERPVKLLFTPTEPGDVRLTVHVNQLQVDRWIHVLPPPRTLLVSADAGGTRTAATLMSTGVKPQRMRPADLPNTAAKLAPYELIVLDRVDAEALGVPALQAMGEWVREGGGIVAFAGDGGLARGGSPEAKEMRKHLPLATIDDEKVEPPPLAIVFILDRSDSMARERKWEVAARTTASAKHELNPKSTMGLITFADFPDWVIKPTTVKEVPDFTDQLTSIRVYGGTDMFPALKQAYEGLAPLDARLKHIVLLSDGVSISRLRYNESTITKLRTSKITVSTVAMGTEADTKTMSEIARRTGGRYWFVKNPDDLPRIFAEETRRTPQDEQVSEALTAHQVKTLAALARLDPARAPWTPTTRARARATSETVWQVDALDPAAEGVERRPLLARARFGQGRSIALAAPATASSLPPSRLMRGLIRAALPPGAMLEATATPGPAGIRIELQRGQSGLLTGSYHLERVPDGEPVRFSRVGPDRMAAMIDAPAQPQLGRVRDRNGVPVAWVTLPAASEAELRPAPFGPRMLALLAQTTRGEVVADVAGPSWLVAAETKSKPRRYRVPLGLLALAAAAASVWARRPRQE